MNIIETLRSACRSLIEDQAGWRFQKLFARIHRLGMAPKMICLVLGFFLTLTGFFLGLVPGIPGIVFGLLGIGLMSALFERSAQLADALELRIRKLFSWLRGLFIVPAPQHVESPTLTPEQLRVNGISMKIRDDGQHTGLESRFEDELTKAFRKMP